MSEAQEWVMTTLYKHLKLKKRHAKLVDSLRRLELRCNQDGFVGVAAAIRRMLKDASASEVGDEQT